MNGLEFYLGKIPLDYTGNNYQNQYKEPLLPYDNNKNFFQLANGQGNIFKCGYSYSLPTHQNSLDDFEKLLKDWRNSSIKKIKTNIKLGHSQKISELEKNISKLNLEIEEVSSELLEIKRKELEQFLTETKNKLDKGSWGYLDILLLCPDKSLIGEKAKENLADKIRIMTYKNYYFFSIKLIIVNHLEEKINNTQQAQIEFLPPSYN